MPENSLNTTDTPFNIKSNFRIDSAIAAAGTKIAIENLDGVVSSDRLVFSRIASLTNPPLRGRAT